MPRAMVIGSPITHSLSPLLHEAGYRAAGLSQWSYGRAEVTAQEVPEFLAQVPADVVGLSVTMPCKEAVLAAAAESSALAREVGSANTLIRRAGQWYADNTDVAGVLNALRDAGCSSSRRAVVIGSGATARAVVAALAQLGVREVAFVVRSQVREQTRELSEKYDMAVTVVSQESPEAPRVVNTAPVVVQTSPAGGSDGLADLIASHSVPACADEGALVGPGRFVLDVVYADWPTRFAQTMAVGGATVVSGMEMLVHQAAAQFELFTGCPAPISDIMEAGRAAVK